MSKRTIVEALAKLGHRTIPNNFYDHIELWKEWYEGQAKFHQYTVYNGVARISKVRKTLGMAKKMSEDKADLLLNEKVEINVEQKATQEYLDTVLDTNNFWVRGNELVELSQALGTGAFVEYLDGEDVNIDYIPAENIFPLAYDNGEITDCAFASEFSDKTGKYYYIQIHTKNASGLYEVENVIITEEGAKGELPEDMEQIWITGSEKPMFQIIKPNLVNNVDRAVPMGISVFANSIPLLEGLDLVYDSYDNEFQLGKKRIFIDTSLLQIDYEKGESKPLFDTNDTTFYGFNMGSDENKKKPIEESNMQIRAQEHELALQSRLNILSSKCGFGQNYYQFDHAGVKTATEVVSENSQLFRRIKKDEIILEKALTDMVRAVLFLGNKNTEEEISIAFDDSIVEDTDAIMKRSLLELQSGLIDNVVYYQRVYGYTEEQAVDFDNKIKARAPQPENVDFFAGGDGGDE